MNSVVGKSIHRVEDYRLLTGAGQYTDDINFDGQLYAVFVRSPHAHAKINVIDASAACKMPGVRAFVHGETLAKLGFQPMESLNRSPEFPICNRDGSQLPLVELWPLARDKVRYVGEPVAAIVANTLSQAIDSAEAVIVDYQPLEAVVELDNALASDAPLIWDHLEDNACVEFESGNRAGVDRAFRQAAHVESIEVEFPRHITAYLEPRTVLARYQENTEKFEIFSGSQSVHWHQKYIAGFLNVSIDKVRFVSPDTGGGFGARTTPYPEMAVVGWLSKFTGCPVKWVTERSECFTTDTQSRDQKMTVQLAVDERGRMTALRLSSLWRLGAYLKPRSIWLHSHYMALMLCGVYKIPSTHFELTGVFTNTAWIGAFRGVARAEVSYAVERVVDSTANSLGYDRVEFRKKNMIRKSDMPWVTSSEAYYIDADFEGNFCKLLENFDFNEYEQRRKTSLQLSKFRGLGFSVFVDSVGGAPNEFAEIEVTENHVEVRVGTKSIGTGHQTTFATVAGGTVADSNAPDSSR